MSRLPRPLARALAACGGWFYLPCNNCGEKYAGFEWRDVNYHRSSIPNLPYQGISSGICQSCTASGVGCRAFANIGIYHDACEHASPDPAETRYVMQCNTP